MLSSVDYLEDDICHDLQACRINSFNNFLQIAETLSEFSDSGDNRCIFVGFYPGSCLVRVV